MTEAVKIRLNRAAFVALFVSLAVLAAASPLSIKAAQANEGFARQHLTIHTAKGPVSFSVEVADNEDKRAHGLMFRRSLKPDEGMIFLFDREEAITMWMKNTFIPLDMVFIGKDRRVIDIARNTEPFSTDIIGPKQPALWVLEINGGAAAKAGIERGDLVDLHK
jgi:uncharacterized membrane protein (UPF0127 family)